MNQPSHYQTAFFRELACRPGVELRVFYATDIAPFRRALGWTDDSPTAYAARVLRGSADALTMAWRHRKAIHLINGIWSVRPFVGASVVLLLLRAQVYFHAEHPDPAHTRGGAWGWVKCFWVRSVFLRAKGLFAIGRRAREFYRRLGVPPGRIFDFMYFQDGGAERRRVSTGSRFRVTYVGQFVPWKRVEDLIAAFSVVKRQVPVGELQVIGAGPLRDQYTAEIARLGLADSAQVRGPVSPAGVREALRESSVLVLPSRFDGWGLTVNEALQVGIPAICSDGCGVADVLETHPGWGRVFAAGDVAGLARALLEIHENPDQFLMEPSDVDAAIGPRVMVDLFLKVVTPVSPN